MEELHEKCAKLNIDLFKWAAACSGYQQANDVGRIHADMQRDVRKLMRALEAEDAAGKISNISAGMAAFESHLRASGMDTESANTYWDFFRVLEQALSSWTASNSESWI